MSVRVSPQDRPYWLAMELLIVTHAGAAMSELRRCQRRHLNTDRTNSGPSDTAADYCVARGKRC